jgi:2-methylcitrate dehydratase PrpD
MTRLGLSIEGPTILYRGIWPTYFAAPFGVAATASRLLRLDATQAAHALALALTWAAPGVGHHNAASGARWLSTGHAARNGLFAAQAAKAGFTSDLALLEGGFFDRIFGIKTAPAKLTDDLGSRAMLSEVSFKPWCAARQTMAATQALKEILAQGVVVDDISQIDAFVLPPHLRMIDHGVEQGDRPSHLTSLQYQLALTALSPEATLDVEQSPDSVPDKIRAFMGKVKVRPDDALLPDYPRIWPARVVVTPRAGRHEHSVTHVPGDPARVFAESDVVEKFRRLVSASQNADRLLELCRNVINGRQTAGALLQAIKAN